MFREHSKSLVNSYGEDIFYNCEKERNVFKDVVYVHPVRSFMGTLTFTNLRVFFISELIEEVFKFEIPFGLIGSIELSGDQPNEPTLIVVECKDTGVFKFMSASKTSVGKDIYDLLTKFSFPLVNDTTDLWAYYLEDKFSSNGWEVFNLAKELRRLDIPNDIWRISQINESFGVCELYPSTLVVPVEIDDEKLKQSAKFRLNGCFPTVSWLNPRNQSVITRCSQPLVGVAEHRSIEDEELIQAILDANTQSHYLQIFDCRSENTAVAQRTKGGGVESTTNYPYCQVTFLSVPNIHIVRESFKKLRNSVSLPLVENSWFSRVDQTGWLENVSLFMNGALKIATAVEYGRRSVVVHSSDGSDRIPVVVSLAMLMLDPYYRTIIGFEVLIEKEWVYFSSNFAIRHGHGTPMYSDSKRSYNFPIFLDCVWQVICQFPNVFEFNEAFLLDILKHCFSAHFGTFLFNSESAMESAEAKVRTVSLWSYLNGRLDEYRNPFYLLDCSPSVILPTVSPIKLKFWKNMYLKHNIASLMTNAMLVMKNGELLQFRKDNDC